MTSSPPTVPRRRPLVRISGRAEGSRLATVAALFVVGTLVSLLGSGTVSLWADEAASLSAARRPVADLLGLVSHFDAVHALYYLGLHVWGSVFGFSPVSVRLPSALAVGVAVVGVHRLAHQAGRPRIAVAAALIAAILPRLTWAGVEARSFGPSAALAVWATVVLLAALRGRRRLWIAYAALLAVGVALNIYVALLVVAHLATLLLVSTPARRLGAWAIAAAAGIATASPVLVLAASQRGQLGDSVLAPATLLRYVVVNQWFLGGTPTAVDGSTDTGTLWATAAVVLACLCWLLMAAAVVGPFAGRRLGSSDPERDAADRPRLLAVAVPWIVLPVVIVVAYSLAVSPLYNPRYFTFATPAVALLVAAGLDEARRRIPVPTRILNPAFASTAAVVIVALCLPIYLSQRAPTGKSGTDWSQVAARVGSETEPGDGVYFAPSDGSRDPVVVRTTRNVEVSYPAAFRGLVDVTLLASAVSDGTLRGTSRSLADSSDILRGLDRVVVIRPVDYPAASAVDDERILEAAGLEPRGRSFEGPMDEILVFARR